jgi:CxxC motif-containing protein (DUF1111 family)
LLVARASNEERWPGRDLVALRRPLTGSLSNDLLALHALLARFGNASKRVERFSLVAIVLQSLLSMAGPTSPASAQNAYSMAADPGARALPADVGSPLPGLSTPEIAYFDAAKARFTEIVSVSGNLPGETGAGLGPRFNGNSCAACHAYPAIGGSSPPTNPQIAVARLDGANNALPPFLSLHGPVREARFALRPDKTPDGNVHQLFVISGRIDAPGCGIHQPDFVTELGRNNVRFRIPTPLFGLVEAVPDVNLKAAFHATAVLRTSLGIDGHFNTNAEDGTITRFGWKAQDKSLLAFAGEAYNVEMGVSNELFPNEVGSIPSCAFNGTPEDGTNLVPSSNSGSPASDYSSDIVNFAAFMRLSTPPAPQALTNITSEGSEVFQAIGCNACHFASQNTGASAIAAMSDVVFHPFSDFAVHRMGQGLADGITQGAAAGDEFRTVPFWGLGQRLFFLHDGRTTDLNQAVLAHASPGSEANRVIDAYLELSPQAANALMQYLRSL